jgi:hypothetical protein
MQKTINEAMKYKALADELGKAIGKKPIPWPKLANIGDCICNFCRLDHCENHESEVLWPNDYDEDELVMKKCKCRRCT